MDRLAEIPRPAPAKRSEANDFTRTKSTRAEGRDDAELRAEERVNDRERPERGSEKPERFALHLAEQKASLEPQDIVEAAETEPPPQDAPAAETPVDGAKTQAKPADISSPKSTSAAADTQLAPRIQGAAPEIPVAAEAPAKLEATPSAAPITAPAAMSAALPVVTNAAQPASTPKPAEIQPAIATAARVDREKPASDVESLGAKVGAPRADGDGHQVQNQGPTRETTVETQKAEAPREMPAARSAEELERAADILRQIRVQISPQISEARIQLQPIELGRVSIHLTLENGRMKTTVRAEKTETLQAIQTHLPELRASMRQHGIDAQDFQLTLGFENRAPRDGDKPPAQSSRRDVAIEATAVERSPSLHAALAKTGVDFYA